MSLINKMLQDLEARQGVATVATAAVYQDLHPVAERARNRASRRRLAVLLGILAIAVAAAYAAAGRSGFIALPFVTAKPAPVPATRAPAPKPATVATVLPPAPAHAIAQDAAGENVSAHAAISPQAHGTAAPDTAPVSPKSVAAAPKPTPTPVSAPPTSAPAASAPPVHSREPSKVRIVKAVKSSTASKSEKRERVARMPTGKRAPVRRTAEHIVRVDKTVRPFTPAEKAESSYRRAVHFLDQGRTADAEASLRVALRAQPTHLKARELAAGLALQGGHWRRAQRLLEEGMREVPSHYLFARLLARVYLDHGSEAKALAVMEKAATQGSDDPDFSSLLGLLYQRVGRHADAVKEYEHSLALRPDNARAWLGYAISLEGLEQWGAAKNAYRRAIQNGGLTPPLVRYADNRLAALRDR